LRHRNNSSYVASTFVVVARALVVVAAFASATACLPPEDQGLPERPEPVSNAAGDIGCASAPSCGNSCGIDACGRWCECGSVDEICTENLACEQLSTRLASCPTCSLRLEVTDIDRNVDGLVTEVSLAVEYNSQDFGTGGTEPKPAMIDVSIMASRAVTLASHTPGDALLGANKVLFRGPPDNQPYQLVLPEGNDWVEYRFLAHSYVNTNTVDTGRLLSLTFTLDDPGAVAFRIKDKPEIAAPSAANVAIQRTSGGDPEAFDVAVVVNNE
jgi:hypothetical protein